ncbi:MAG: 16S rRNA (guanine(527)-N(7))-methyltransferase RsmG [Gaiellales bacterium]
MKQDPLEQFLTLVATAPQRLVASTDPEALAAHVDDARGTLPLIAAETGPLIDVGTGAGFPGVPLLLDRADLAGTLLDSRAKRCQHLQQVVDVTGLAARVRVLNLRAEEHAAADGREHYGIAVARALAPPPVAIELCLPLLRTGGVCILHAGAVNRTEVERAAAELGGVLELIDPVPGFDARNRVVVRKTDPTPARFPRRIGLAAKEPLVRSQD